MMTGHMHVNGRMLQMCSTSRWLSAVSVETGRQPPAAAGKPWESVELLVVCLVSGPQSAPWQQAVNTASTAAAGCQLA